MPFSQSTTQWGPNGGGITPVGAPAPVGQTQTTGTRKANQIVGDDAILAKEARGSLSLNTADNTLSTSGSFRGA